MNLYEYYKINFLMQQEHSWSIAMIEEFIPFERDVYIGLLAEHIQKKIEQQKQR